jgi:hypothetical protein
MIRENGGTKNHDKSCIKKTRQLFKKITLVVVVMYPIKA